MKKEIPIVKIIVLVSILLFLVDFLIGFFMGILELPDTILIDFFSELVSATIFIYILHYVAKSFLDDNVFDSFKNNLGTLKLLIVGSLGIFVIIATKYITEPIAKLLPTFQIFDEIYEEIFQVPENTFELILLFFSTTIITAVVEEFFFRGFLYKTLRKKYNILASILILSIIFFFFHLNPQMLIFVIVANIVLCMAFEFSKSLYLPIFIHTGTNAITVILVLSNY